MAEVEKGVADGPTVLASDKDPHAKGLSVTIPLKVTSFRHPKPAATPRRESTLGYIQ
jgi:hypothetical protein